MKYPIYIQSDYYECGPACIYMLLKYYGIDSEVREIKEKAKTFEEGTSVYGMMQACSYYHMDAKALSYDDVKKVKFPCIAMVDREGNQHFVVIYKRIFGYLIIGDPAKGIVRVKEKEVLQHFLKVVIEVYHVGRVKGEHQDYHHFLLQDILKNKKELGKLSFLSFTVSLFSFLYAYLFEKFMDLHSIYFLLGLLLIEVIRELQIYLHQSSMTMLTLKLKKSYEIPAVSNYIYTPFANVREDALMKFRTIEDMIQSSVYIESMIFYDGLFLLCITILLSYLSYTVLLFLLMYFFFLLLLSKFYVKRMEYMNKEVLRKKEKKEAVCKELLANFTSIHFFTQKKYIKDKLRYIFTRYNDTCKHQDIFINKYSFFMQTVIHTGMLIILLLASKTTDNVMSVYVLLNFLNEPMLDLIQVLISSHKAEVYYERYKQILCKKEKRKKKIKKIEKIECRHVVYSYHYDHIVLHDCNLLIDSSLVLKGNNGSGKSTLLRLLMGFDQVEKGEILINDININDLDLSSLYRKMILLEKVPIFFEESLRYNLLLDSKEEIYMIYLLRLFNLERLIPLLNEKLDLQGSMLSSGEAQAVMIIRAILVKPDVLILDEALSYIESSLALKMLYYMVNNCKVILVSHQINVMNSEFKCAIMENINGGKV